MEVTAWTRLIPQLVDQTLADGIQAMIADPLWLLTRQWQLGELDMSNGGSPAWCSLDAAAHPLSDYSRADGTPIGASALGPTPPEVLIEADRQPLADADDATAARAGLAFLRTLREALGTDRAAYVAYRSRLLDPMADPCYLLKLVDADSSPFLRAVDGEAPDGRVLAASTDAESLPKVTGVDQGAVARAALAWRARYAALLGESLPGAAAWERDRLEYQFRAAAPDDAASPLSVIATQHTSSRLDWYSFERTSSPATSTSAPTHSVRALPTPARFAGMPLSRFWELEDAKVDLANVSVSSDDLTTIAAVEYVLCYSDEFYVVPLRVPAGSVCRITTLTVRDSFGTTLNVQPAATIDRPEFRLFQLSCAEDEAPDAKPDPVFLAFDTTDDTIVGPTLEHVSLLRDELANVCWAVELTTTGQDGMPIDRAAQVAILRAPW